MFKMKLMPMWQSKVYKGSFVTYDIWNPIYPVILVRILDKYQEAQARKHNVSFAYLYNSKC